MFDRIRLATVFILITLSNCFSDAAIGIPKNQTFLLQLESKLAQNQWIWNSQILSTLSQEFCKLLTAIDVKSFARDIGQNDELTEGQKEAFGQLQEIMQRNCREHNQMLGKGSAKEVETVRQHLTQIMGHGLVVPKPFDPLNIAKLNEAASRVETRRPMKWIERKIISHLVQKLPNGFWLKPTFERILADKGQIASYGLELFQQVWGHFFDAEGRPTSVTEELVSNGKQQQQQKTAFFSSFKFAQRRRKRQGPISILMTGCALIFGIYMSIGALAVLGQILVRLIDLAPVLLLILPILAIKIVIQIARG